jgi:hypothetical protein
MKKKWFFGWFNIKFLIKELVKLYSNEPSYFSKKRVESGIAFIVGQWGMNLTPGTYTWSWGTGGNVSTLVMTINS